MEEAFSGAELVLPEGYDAVPKHLSQSLDIRLKSVVTAVPVIETDVKIESEQQSFLADHCVVTSPLGVAKSWSREILTRMACHQTPTYAVRMGRVAEERQAAALARQHGQLYKGERTHIGWTAREIVLPTIPGSNASGATITVAGITGRIRGKKYKRADGKTVRPTLVVLDERGSRAERVGLDGRGEGATAVTTNLSGGEARNPSMSRQPVTLGNHPRA
jgi:hypothetical protein